MKNRKCKTEKSRLRKDQFANITTEAIETTVFSKLFGYKKKRILPPKSLFRLEIFTIKNPRSVVISSADIEIRMKQAYGPYHGLSDLV